VNVVEQTDEEDTERESEMSEEETFRSINYKSFLYIN
jgi:hypothetical protein